MTHPTPPPGLDALEAHIMAHPLPAERIAGRATMRELIAYVRALEAQAARLRARARTTVFVEEGNFW